LGHPTRSNPQLLTTKVLEQVADMPLDDGRRRKLRATLLRWVRTLRDAGHAIPDL
jgi:hypothetical protein